METSSSEQKSETISRTVHYRWASSLTGTVFESRARIYDYLGESNEKFFASFQDLKFGVWRNTSCPPQGLVMATAKRIEELRNQCNT